MGQWNGLSGRNEVIQVRGGSPVNLMLRQSPHGPIITDLLQNPPAQAPIALWWTFLQADNTLLDAFYALNRADEVAKARDAASKIQSPGFNVMWASGNGDIAWWAAAKLPQRPAGVNPVFVLDAGKGEAEKPGYYSFAFNPQEENPARGYIMSANHQPKPGNGVPVPGYYSLADRAQRLDDVLRDPNRKWDTLAAQQLQIDPSNGYALRVLGDLLPTLKQVVTDANERAFLEPLEKWDGFYGRDSIAATLFTQLMYELARAALADELGEVQFDSLLHTRAIDGALARLVADPKSPWWDDVKTPQKENHFEIARLAWSKTLTHLQSLYGSNLVDWTWGKSHTLTHLHALAWNRPLGWLFDVGPFALAGSRETPNNQSFTPSPGPWPVNFGPSARRVIDFGDPARATGINPVGQSGVLFDAHYSDQAGLFSEGLYQPMHLSDADVKQHTASTLTLTPSP
jgi:penicillin amidase